MPTSGQPVNSSPDEHNEMHVAIAVVAVALLAIGVGLINIKVGRG